MQFKVFGRLIGLKYASIANIMIGKQAYKLQIYLKKIDNLGSSTEELGLSRIH